jgi:dienelactone hydrolase
MRRLAIVISLLACAWVVSAKPAPAGEGRTDAVHGSVRFELAGPQDNVPGEYCLKPHEFDYWLTRRRSLAGIKVDLYDLKFPSVVESETPQNNTVVCEYYRPEQGGPFPGVIVLDILGGDQTLGRSQASLFAQNGVAALFMQMAYYGPRRPPGSRLRLVSTDLEHSLKAVRQTVLDVRRAAAWLAARTEIDPDRLGICGTSLGSFMGSLAAEMEPRLKRVAIVLGGGGLVDAFYDHPRAYALRTLYEVMGGSKEKLQARLAIVDPLTRAENLKDRKVIMIGASRDDVVPPEATKRLWEALGRPRIVWYDATHTGAALFLMPALREVIQHFKE